MRAKERKRREEWGEWKEWLTCQSWRLRGDSGVWQEQNMRDLRAARSGAGSHRCHDLLHTNHVIHLSPCNAGIWDYCTFKLTFTGGVCCVYINFSLLSLGSTIHVWKQQYKGFVRWKGVEKWLSWHRWRSVPALKTTRTKKMPLFT